MRRPRLVRPFVVAYVIVRLHVCFKFLIVSRPANLEQVYSRRFQIFVLFITVIIVSKPVHSPRPFFNSLINFTPLA